MIKTVLFDVDDCLYASTEFAEKARRNAVDEIVCAGVKEEKEKPYQELMEIVKEHGSNYSKHFDELAERKGFSPKERFVAAAEKGYHEAKAQIKPFPGVIKTLLGLRDKGLKLEVKSTGIPVKQWDKLFRLGLQDLFHYVFIEPKGLKANGGPYKRTAKGFGVKPGEVMVVRDRIDADITGANKAGMRSVRILQGAYSKKSPKKQGRRTRL